MSVAVTAADRLSGYLPPYYGQDAYAAAYRRAIGNEIDRLDAAITAIRTQFVPGIGDGSYGMLPLWEAVLGVAPLPGASTADREAAIEAKYRARTSGGGAVWQDRLTSILGPSATYTEGPGPYQITVGYPPGFTSAQVTALLRPFTPAHLDIAPTTVAGFLTGSGEVGADVL
jgi:hypothetical protein